MLFIFIEKFKFSLFLCLLIIIIIFVKISFYVKYSSIFEDCVFLCVFVRI